MNNFTNKRKFSRTLNPTGLAAKPATPEGQCPTGVFLGGACNPTTWRKDIAVPFLEENRIPYFNPQVDEWCPELIAKEAAAKEQASCLLFVLQPHLTRGLASLVEVAYLAAIFSSQASPTRIQQMKRLRSRQPRILVVVRPPLFSSLQSNKKSDTTAEAANIEAAYEWLEGLQLPNVHFFELLEDALQYIRQFYSNQSNPKGLQSPKHSGWRRGRRMLKSCSELEPNWDITRVNQERLMAAYHYSTSCRDITPDSDIDLYFGGAPPKKLQMLGEFQNCISWVVGRQGIKRDFALSMAVQRRCSRLYFHISRTGLWVIEQMEAAFAIGSGKEVFICIEFLNDEDAGLRGARSGSSSGYSSLASTPDEIFRPPTVVTAFSSASTSSAPSRSASYSEYEEQRATEVIKTHVTIPEKDAVVKALSKHTFDLLLPVSDVFGLSPAAVKDHNRCRSYLKSLLEGLGEEGHRGFVLNSPVESIGDLVDLL